MATKRSALLVIDIQQGAFTGRVPHHVEGVVDRIKQLAGRVRAADGVVVYVQHDGPHGDPLHPSQPGGRLLPGLESHEYGLFVRKTSCGAFLDTELDAALRSACPERLIVTGYIATWADFLSPVGPAASGRRTEIAV